ncbi:MAG: VanZ family protein [Gammaproteobacteria bacterium]|nr:VanZ family protein [Gammaproteobacteria bacterium]
MEYKLTFLARIALLLMLTAGVYLAAVEGGPVAAADVNDKIVHLTAFFVLALCADYAFPRRRFDWFTVLQLLSYGLLIEVMQLFIPYRSFSLADLAADAAGLVIYAATILILRQISPPISRRFLTGQ